MVCADSAVQSANVLATAIGLHGLDLKQRRRCLAEFRPIGSVPTLP